MISDRSDFRAHIRRLFVTMIKMSYQGICNHPFLLGFVGFLYFLHRTCPLLFAPLVTASPVLLCTFILLGTILSYGEPNLPEIEKELETVQEAALSRTEVSRDATVVERSDKSFTVERFMRKEKDVVEDGNDDVDRLGENHLTDVEDNVRSFDYRPLVDETLDEVKRDTQVRFEEKAFVVELEKRGERKEEKLTENGEMQVSSAELSWKNDKSFYEMLDDSKEDQMDVSPVSPWRPMRHEEDEDDDADRDDSLDSGSDGAESSSPDASMTDITPMLDELHPLLHLEDSSRGIADGEGSDAASERSSSDEEEIESNVDSESHGEEGDNENEEEEEDEEEEEKEKKDDESKSAIKWTEIDQKNVMDLGSLELERNQRLENVIAKRRARHNMRLMAERNLIDLDSTDVPTNMPPISTARQNPFDHPDQYDPYDDMGLPPIPGSAPSIMLARKNPFYQYEPKEENADLNGDGSQEDSSSQQPKDPMFRRHESFSVGPSMLGGPRHDRLRPFFVLERLANEGTSYYPFERQLSEISESKASSVPDTESVCTILEDDENKVDEHDDDRESEIVKVDRACDHDDESNHSASDHDDESNHSASDHDDESNHSASDHDEEKSHSASDHDEDKSHLASDIDEDKSHLSEDSDFGGQADDSRNLHHDVAEIILGSGETHHEQSNMREGETSDEEKLDEDDSSDSDSSLSEIEENMQDLNENESILISEREVDLHEESGMSSQPSFEDSEIHVARVVEDDYHHDETRAGDSFITAQPSLEESAIHELCGSVDEHPVEPVYDSSPSASRVPSFSSVSSDYKLDLPAKTEVETSTHVAGEASLITAEIGIDGQNNSTVSGAESENALLDPSSQPLERNENAESDSSSVSSQEDLEELQEEVKEAVNTRALDVDASLVDDSPKEEELVSTGMVEQRSPTVTTSEESPEVVHDIGESSVDRSVAEGIQQKEDEASSQTFNEDIPIDSYSNLSSGAVEYVETHSYNEEYVPQLEQDAAKSSVSDTNEETHPNQTMDIEVDSVNSSAHNVGSDEATPSESNRELTWSDKSVVEQSSLEASENQVPTREGPVSVVFSRNITFHEYHDAPEDTAELSFLTSDSSSSPADSPEYTTPMVGEGSRAEFFKEDIDQVVERLDQLTDLHEVSQSPPEVITEEAEEIKEIDGGLSELDTVRELSVKEVVTDSEPGPSTIGSETDNEVSEALPVLEARSVEDIESIESSNVVLSDEVVTEEVKAETASNTGSKVESPRDSD